MDVGNISLSVTDTKKALRTTIPLTVNRNAKYPHGDVSSLHETAWMLLSVFRCVNREIWQIFCLLCLFFSNKRVVHILSSKCT